MPQKISNQTEKVVISLIIIVGIVGGYFYYSSVVSVEISVIPAPIIGRDLKKFEKINFDFSIFDKIAFKELKIFGEHPLEPGTEGKADLFAPF